MRFSMRFMNMMRQRKSFQSRSSYEFFNNRMHFQVLMTGQRPFHHHPHFYYYVAGIGTLSGVYYISQLETVPMSGRSRFMNVSKELERYSGELGYKETMKEYGRLVLPSHHPTVRSVTQVAHNLIKANDLKDADWKVYVIDAPVANAFVLPGGKIFVFTGILPITQNEDGLAAVLGHELAHQFARHAAEQMSRMSIFLLARFLLSFVTDTSLLYNRAILQLGILNPHSRTCESEADYIGLLFMAKACYDPAGAIEFWKRMKREDHGAPPEFLSTHPSSDTRMKQIESWIPEARMKQESAGCYQTFSFYDSFTKSPQWFQ